MGTNKRSTETRTKLPTFMADLAGIDRINPINFYSSSLCFIGNEVLQLEEVPVINPVIHSSASSQLSYSFKVLHYNPVSIKAGNNIFADIVVMPSHEPLLFPRELPEKSLTGESAFGLQFATQISELPFDLLDFTAIIESAIRSDSEIIYAEVNAKNSMITRADINLFSKSKEEETSSFSVYPEQAFLYIPSEVFLIAVWNGERQLDSALDSRYTEDIAFKGSRPWKVISDAGFVDDWLASCSFNHSCCLLDAGYCQLSWQSSLSQALIDEWMQFNIVPDFMLPSYINAELQSLAVNLYSSDYVWSGWNLDFGCCSSNHSYYANFDAYKPIGGDGCNSSLQ